MCADHQTVPPRSRVDDCPRPLPVVRLVSVTLRGFQHVPECGAVGTGLMERPASRFARRCGPGEVQTAAEDLLFYYSF